MKSGIAPALLVSQVKNTAAWLWERPSPAVRFLEGTDYFRILLAAHWATVATFVPTDVDARIRHHHWQALGTAAQIAGALDVLDEVISWDVHAVSERVLDGARGTLAGHDGEWLSVRAGALYRAAVLGADAEIERLVGALDAELDREESILRAALAGTAQAALSAATIVAHNLGDLSRVAMEWPKNPVLDALKPRYVRLGHEGSPRPLFVTAGTLNKALVAHENHRFLPLRKPRALRTARALLLPIGPWLDGWGERIATASELEPGDRAEVLAALLEIHGRDDRQEGCLRAIAGMHRKLKGGIEVLVPDLPARMRKDAVRGKVRDVLDVGPEHFATRIERKLKAARA